MAVVTKEIMGAKGLNQDTSKFLIDPREAQILENISVRTGTRKRRQQYKRWKHDKFASNAARFIGTYKKSFCIVKDVDNTKYNSFGTGQSSTVEIRFRLPGVGGYSLKSTIYLASRQIHGTGYTFQVNLINTGAAAYDEYRAQLIVSDGSGTTTIDLTNTKVKHGIWYTLTVLRDNANTRFRALLDGVFIENVAFGATHTGAQGTFGTTRDDSTFSDIVLAANNALSDFAPVDIDEFRLWNEARSDANVLAYYNKEVPSSARTNMICYVNFQDSHDGYMGVDKINSNCPVFFGGSPPFKDANDYLVFDGSTQFGLLDPIGGVLTIPYNLWGGGNGGAIIHVNEVRFKVLKLKQCNIIGGLAMYYDSGNGKYGFRFRFANNGANTTIDSGGIVALADVDVTEYTVSVRGINNATARIELWVNGVKKATTNYVGVHGHPSGEPGKYIAANPAGTGAFAAIRLKWFRVFDAEVPFDDTYFETKYADEVDDFKLNEYSHGVATLDFVNATQRQFTGTSTNLNANFQVTVPPEDHRYLSIKENKEDLGENYQDQISNLNTGAQTFDLLQAVSTGDPWAAGRTKICNKEGYLLTMLLTRYNADSWRNIKIDKDSTEKIAFTTSLMTGGKDRDSDPLHQLKLYYYVNATIEKRESKVEFISGITRLDSLKPTRYLGAFKSLDLSIDVIISIVGTSFNVFNRSTKVLTQYPICILPNSDKPFIGDILNGELYLTDGLTRIHCYVFKKQLRVVKWGLDRPQIRIGPTGYVNGGPWSAILQYTYCYYNREIDQFGPLTYVDLDGEQPQETLATKYAVQLDGLQPAPDFYSGASDIAIFRTKDMTAGVGIIGHNWLYDFVRGNSQGAMDWSQSDARLAQRYPIEISAAVDDMGPPSGEFVVAHNKRLWVPRDDGIAFSRIGSELHEGVVKSETYLFPGDHIIRVPGNRKLTGAVSLYDRVLFVFTNSSMDMITGNDISDFEFRGVHGGIGCVSHRSIVKYGQTCVWLGFDDIYTFDNDEVREYDKQGRVSEFIKNSLDRTRLGESFAVLNRNKRLYELHAIDTSGNWITLVLDLKNAQFSVYKDIRATYGAEIADSYNKPVIFYGTKEGFIINEDTSGQNYQPDSGSVKTTISSWNAGTRVATVAASDLQITEAGLIGNICYIVSKATATEGSVLKALIIDNTATTITLSATDTETVFGVSFTPASADDVYIGPIFMKWKSPTHLITATQADQLTPNNEVSDINAAELIAVNIVHNRASASANCYISLYRDGQSTISKTAKVLSLDKHFSIVHMANTSRAQFFELEMFYLHESVEFEHIGYGLELDISRDTVHGTS